MTRQKIKDSFTAFLRPLIWFLVRRRLHPDVLTMFGVILSLVAAYTFSTGYVRISGLLVLLAGLFDVLDGQVARAARKGNKFGALLDSTADRYSEIFVAFGIAVYLIRNAWWTTSAILFFALAGSLMVSYVRARAEGLGEECTVGFMQRPERILSIGLGSLIGGTALIFVLWSVALLTNYTVVQRLRYIWKKSRKQVGLNVPK